MCSYNQDNEGFLKQTSANTQFIQSWPQRALRAATGPGTSLNFHNDEPADIVSPSSILSAIFIKEH